MRNKTKKRCFYRAREKRISSKMASMVTRLKQTLICAAIVLMAAPATAKDPLDFNYRIAGDAKVRPILVFNDGQDVYIQPNPETATDIKIVGATSEKQGPYLVIRGLADSFSVRLKKGGAAEVSYKGAKPIARPTLAARQAPDVPRALETKPPVSLDQGKTASLDQGKTASLAQGKTASLAQVDTCVPRVERKESAFVVSFPAKATRMSAQAESQLKQALVSVSDIGVVEITAEDMQGSKKIAADRATAIRAFVASQGVADGKIKTTTREATGIGSELRVVHQTTVPCKTTGMKIAVLGSGQVSIAGEADVKAVVVQLAAEAKLDLSIEGTERPMRIALAEIDKPLVSVLESIGNKLGDKADLVYRGKALVLRYRPTN